MDHEIVIRGAREHNLRSIDLKLPRGKLICFTGVSGSGKSSLAFDTLFAEGQRRYIESLSTHARQFVEQLPKPDVDLLTGLSPSISISQKSTGNNPRSTVGTVTEIHDFLRVLFARVGTGCCPSCRVDIEAQSRDQIIDKLQNLPATCEYLVLAPVVRRQKGEHREVFEGLMKQGLARVRVNGKLFKLDSPPVLERQLRHDIEAVIDRFDLQRTSRQRLADAVEAALRLGEGMLKIVPFDDAPDAQPLSAKDEVLFSANYACPRCGQSYDAPSPQLLSFNSPVGMCRDCDGLGIQFSFDCDLLVDNPKKSLKAGAIGLMGTWSHWSRANRRLYESVASAIGKEKGLSEDYLLKTSWNELTEDQRKIWLFGTGDRNITVTWRSGARPLKYGSTFAGIVPLLLSQWNNFKNPMQRKQYENYMRSGECSSCKGQRLNPQARNLRLPSFTN